MIMTCKPPYLGFNGRLGQSWQHKAWRHGHCWRWPDTCQVWTTQEHAIWVWQEGKLALKQVLHSQPACSWRLQARASHKTLCCSFERMSHKHLDFTYVNSTVNWELGCAETEHIHFEFEILLDVHLCVQMQAWLRPPVPIEPELLALY